MENPLPESLRNLGFNFAINDYMLILLFTDFFYKTFIFPNSIEYFIFFRDNLDICYIYIQIHFLFEIRIILFALALFGVDGNDIILTKA